METVDHLHRFAKEFLDGRGVRLGHIHHHHFDPLEFRLPTTLEPSDDILSPSPFQCGNWPPFVQIDDRGVVMMSLAPGVFINANSTAQLAGTSAPTALTGPAKHGAFGDPIASGQLAARTTAKKLGADLLIEAISPLNACAEG